MPAWLTCVCHMPRIDVALLLDTPQAAGEFGARVACLGICRRFGAR